MLPPTFKYVSVALDFLSCFLHTFICLYICPNFCTLTSDTNLFLKIINKISVFSPDFPGLWNTSKYQLWSCLIPSTLSVLQSWLWQVFSTLLARFFPEALALPVAACPHHFPYLFLSIPGTQTHKNIFRTLLKALLEVCFPSFSYLLPGCDSVKDTVSIYQQN